MSLLLSLMLLMPPSPEVLEQMRKSGNLQSWVSIMEDARKRGMDAPSEELMDKMNKEMQVARETKTKVIRRAVVIMCDFSDNVGTTPAAHYDSLTNGPFTTGSVKEFYLENSYGYLEFQFLVTPVWVRLPNPYTYYTNNQYGMGNWPQNAQKMAYDAVVAADPYIDFSQCDMDNDGKVDALVIVHAGPGAESTNNPNHIWSHAWVIPVTLIVDGKQAYWYTTVPEDAGCGVIAHELGHRPLGLPDLYDTDYTSEGLGNWSLMAGGSWNGRGAIPSHLDAWCKYRLGFVRVDTVRSNRIYQSIPAVEDTGIIFRLWTNGATGNRYFLVENRRLKKFDRALPGEGLLIYHVDDARPNNNNEWYPGQDYRYHYKVALEQADGRWDLERKINRGDAGDPWPGTSNNRDFHNYSIPDSKDYGNPMIKTYVGVLNISDPGDTMYADLMVTSYNNIKVTSISVPRADTLNASSEFKLRLFNNGFTLLNKDLNFKVYNESGDLVYDTTVTGISVDTGRACTVSVYFTPSIDDCEYSYRIGLTTTEDVPRDDSLIGLYYAKSIVRGYDVARSEGDNYWMPHIVDGVVDGLEYYGAPWLDISNFLAANGETHRTIRKTYMKSHIFHDTLFVAFKVIGDSTLGNNDYITFVIDDNGDGSFPASNSNEGEITFRDGTTRLSYFRPYTSSGTGAMQTLTLPQAYTVKNNVKYAEVAIPIGLSGSGPAYYLNLSGDYSSFVPKFFVKVTDGSKIVGWWPQNTPYATTVRDISYFATLTSTPVSVIERPLRYEVKVDWKGPYMVLRGAGLKGKSLKVSLYDASGRKVVERLVKVSDSESEKMDLRNLASGVYFAEVEMDGKVIGSYKGVLIK